MGEAGEKGGELEYSHPRIKSSRLPAKRTQTARWRDQGKCEIESRRGHGNCWDFLNISEK